MNTSVKYIKFSWENSEDPSDLCMYSVVVVEWWWGTAISAVGGEGDILVFLLFVHYHLTLVLLNLDMPCLCKSVDPDQLAPEETNWSGSALFIIQ